MCVATGHVLPGALVGELPEASRHLVLLALLHVRRLEQRRLLLLLVGLGRSRRGRRDGQDAVFEQMCRPAAVEQQKPHDHQDERNRQKSGQTKKERGVSERVDAISYSRIRISAQNAYQLLEHTSPRKEVRGSA